MERYVLKCSDISVIQELVVVENSSMAVDMHKEEEVFECML